MMSNIEYVYILILNYNDFVKTIDCINSIFNSKYKNYKIIIIDNNSSDDSKNNFTKWIEVNNYSSIQLIENSRNGGYAYGNNKGIEIASRNDDCKFIWVLNNDTLIDENALLELINYFDSKVMTIYGSKIINYNNSETESIGGIINKNNLKTINNLDKNINIDYIPGVSLFFNKNIVSKIGLFPEEYFMYYEDVDWCTKALKNNIKLMVAVNSLVYHNRNKSNRIKIRSLYNRLRYCIKYYPSKILNVIYGIVFQKYLITK